MFKKILGKHKWKYATTILLSILAASFMALFSVKLGKVVDVVTNPDGESLFTKIFFCFMAVILWYIVSTIYSFLMVSYIKDVVRDLKKRIYISFFSQEINEYKFRTGGAYLNLLTKDIDILIENYLIPRCVIILNIFYASISIIAIFIISWKLALSFFVITIITVLLSQVPSGFVKRKTMEFSKKSKSYLEVMTNYLNGFEQIRLLNIGDAFNKKINILDNEYEIKRKQYFLSKEISDGYTRFIGYISQLLCMSIGIYFTLEHEITLGLLVTSIALLGGVIGPVQYIGNAKNLMSTSHGIIEHLEERIGEIKEEGMSLIGHIQSLELKNVHLNFQGKNILENFSHTFEENKKYAIIGESGRGKSTLVKMLLKYIPESNYTGEVKINGIDVSKLSSTTIYSKVGFVQRNEFLIDGDIQSNILLYRDLDSSMNKKLNEVYTELSLEYLKSKDNMKGEDVVLSAGEKQRIDISRFLINNYDVIIFDEPTSNLDPAISRLIYDYILKIEDKIVIVITHNQENELLERFDEVIHLI